ncbi:MAG: DNA ligase [Rubrivivax sp.]|nr:DNA ligase [Rubrivivax sp.]
MIGREAAAPAADGAVQPTGPLSRRGLLGLALASVCLPALAARSLQPLPIPLAQEAPADLDPAQHLVSEKYDGVRAVWDGRELRFRSGLLIAAPRSFLAGLPAYALDGELWLGRGRFEALSGVVRKRQPLESEWRELRYMAFDLPQARGGFAERAQELSDRLRKHGFAPLQAAPQARLANRAALHSRLDEVIATGGEGLVLRHEDAPYAAGRQATMLKLKPLHDAEATVLAIELGQGQLQGLMGALHVRADDGRRFKIGTGFSAAQRRSPPQPGERVTYTHRGFTEDGLPRFASFLRTRPAGL